jgi:hypothetical protein
MSKKVRCHGVAGQAHIFSEDVQPGHYICGRCGQSKDGQEVIYYCIDCKRAVNLVNGQRCAKCYRSTFGRGFKKDCR